MSQQNINPLYLKQKIRWLPADTETPISLFLKMGTGREGILLESAEVDGKWGRYSILALDMGFYITCKNGRLSLRIQNDKFQKFALLDGRPFIEGLRALMNNLHVEPAAKGESLPPLTRALFGYLGFGMISIFNPHLAKQIPIEEAECVLGFPETILVFDHLYNRLCQLATGELRRIPEYQGIQSQPDLEIDLSHIKSEPSENGYKDFVKIIRNQLYQGEAIQVVPSTRFSVPFSGDPFLLYRRLRRFNPSPYMFYMKFPDLAFFGSSPEIMVSCSEDNLLLAPIAGTRKRGKTDQEDQEFAEQLLADPKDRAEHVMLVDLGRNDLGRLAKPGTVNVEKYMEVERFSHVMHLTSKITAILDRETRPQDALDVLAAAFPAGTVSGAPKMAALKIIRQLEGQSRGPYAGCIGWIGLDKNAVNLDMGITIRSMWVKDGKIFWQAGGGIVHDSDPEMEWQEVLNKSAIMRLVLQKENEEYVPFNR